MKEFQRSCFLPSSKLSRDDITKLLGLVSQGFPDMQYSISTKSGGYRIRSTSISKFFDEHDLPDEISDLSLSCSGSDKSVNISFYSFSSSLDVSGKDEDWVIGKFSRIRDYISGKRRFLWFIRHYKSVIVFSLLSCFFIVYN